MESPLLEYTPACAPASGAFYRGSALAQFKGNFFFGCLAGRGLQRVVLDGRAGLCERKPAAGAFAAAAHRPSRRRTAALAPRGADAAQGGGAAAADLLARTRAGQTALRQEQIEHISTLRAKV